MRWFAVACAGIFVVACSSSSSSPASPDAGPARGALGGACLSLDLCTPGLVCVDGVCEKAGAPHHSPPSDAGSDSAPDVDAGD